MKGIFLVTILFILLSACSSSPNIETNSNSIFINYQNINNETSTLEVSTSVEPTSSTGANENNYITLEDVKKQGEKIIDEQSFWVTFENFGKVRFVSSVYFEGSLCKSRFYLINENENVIYQFPEFIGNEWSMLDDVGAVSFRDANNDGLKDAIIIAYYMTDVGKNGAVSFPVCSIYFQKESSFENDSDLDTKINDSSQNDSINNVLKFVESIYN